MRVDVVFLPTLLRRPERSVCVVIDVLRATSSLVTLLGRGVREVTVVAEQEQALALRASRAAAAGGPPLVCGEVNSVPPPGFDYGNSAVEFSRLDLHGRSAVLFTSNGTKALVHLSAAPAVFAGAMLNRTAVVDAAHATARERKLDLTLVCSGTENGTTFCLEDAYCAGAVVETLAARQAGGLVLGDGANAALRLYRSFGGAALAAFHESEHGRALARAGFAADLEYCAQLDEFAIVPRAYQEGGMVVVRG